MDFVHEVQPIFKESCYSCHGPEKSKAGLQLDTKARAMKGGENGVAIVPGNSAKSPLVARLTSRDPEERMPQKAEPLSPYKIKVIRDWIDQGAVWPEVVAGTDPARHWAFPRLTHPQPPNVKNRRWVRTPIDNFVQAKLEEKKIAPNGAAERRKLIRRAYLDLLGLPPKPEEVDAFAADTSAKAHEKLITREEAVKRIPADSLSHVLAPIFDRASAKSATMIATGLPAGPGGIQPLPGIDLAKNGRERARRRRALECIHQSAWPFVSCIASRSAIQSSSQIPRSINTSSWPRTGKYRAEKRLR